MPAPTSLGSEPAVPGLDSTGIAGWAQRFELLADANRLRLLVWLHHTPDQNVTELAAAVGMSATAASHALRILRHQGWVTATRTGRIMRYRLTDETIHRLLHWIGAPHAPAPRPH
ncbi:metalloregulator ArsR/SmtB family transcription factor [Nocardia sp. NPDC050697]|uniref:ArsR/SmtB family transcription factor n=1 Tax=Nocardia sp. NPDC050697 TaxID=3155158 RepID=UPI00340D5EDE